MECLGVFQAISDVVHLPKMSTLDSDTKKENNFVVKVKGVVQLRAMV